MSWKHFGFLTILILLGNGVALAVGERARWAAFAGLAGVGYLVVLVLRRRWDQRIAKLRDATDEAREAQFGHMSAEEQAAARIALDMVSSDDADASPDGELFTYPRTPALLREGTFWLSVAIAALGYAAIILGWNHEDRWYSLALGLGFTISVGFQLRAWDHESRTVRLTSSGIQSAFADGRREGMLWSEIDLVRNRPWLTRIEVLALDGHREIRVDYNLIAFARFLELVIAHVQLSRERAA